jgi:hypothetical protein
MPTTNDSTTALPVRGVYLYFRALERTTAPDGRNALEAFLSECDKRQLKLLVSGDLYQLGHDHFSGLVRIQAAGPDCPACPNPPKIG